jgi:polyhydroxyalkanoate synthesis regulator phasin
MTMNRLWKILVGAVLVAVVGVAVLGASVYAQDAPTAVPEAGLSDYVGQVWDAIAQKLGVERSALDAAVTSAREDVAAQAVDDGKLTQDQADRLLQIPNGGTDFGFGMRGGMRGGMHGHRGGMPDCMGDKAAIAKALGITEDELDATLKAGKTLDDLAEEKGVDLQAVRTAEQKANIEQAVKDGKLTQEQADWMLEGLDKGFSAGRDGFGGGPGFGRPGFDRGLAPDQGQSGQDTAPTQSNL